MEVGKKIKLIREAKGLLAKEVAAHLKISASNYSRYESDDREPTIEQLFDISRLLGVSLDELVQYGDSPKESKIESESALQRMRLIESLNNKDKEILDGIINAMINSDRLKKIIRESTEAVRE